MSRPPALVEMDERHVLVVRAIRDGRTATDLPRRWPSYGTGARAPLRARGVRAKRDAAIDQLERAMVAGRIPRGLPLDLWPPPDVREQGMNLGSGARAERARRDLLRQWLAGAPEPADAAGLGDRELLSLRALREGWPPGQLARRTPRRDPPGELSVCRGAAPKIRTLALNRLVRAIVRDQPPAGLPLGLWPPEDIRESVRTAGEGGDGFDPRRELVRRWLEDPTLTSQGPRSRWQGVRRGRLSWVRDPAELEATDGTGG